MKQATKAISVFAAVLCLSASFAMPAQATAQSDDKTDSAISSILRDANWETDNESPFVDSSEGSLTGSATTTPEGVATMAAAQIGLNPWRCAGYTERVHKSNGFGSLHSGIKDCRKSPDYQITGAEIMKKGWVGLWHRASFHHREVTKKTMSKIDVNSKFVCASNSAQTYRGNGYHRVTFGTTNFSGRTSSDIETRFYCNN